MLADTIICNIGDAAKAVLNLPLISLGLWHNFGKIDDYQNCRNIVHTAFDNGITHFDLANNYAPHQELLKKHSGRCLKKI